MNRATPNQTDDSEEFIRDLLHEAGDPAVTPRPEHVADLRALILDSLGAPRCNTRKRSRLLIGSGLAALALAASVLAVVLFRPENAWAQVAQALQRQAWVHTRSLGPDGKQYGEGWFSPKTGVVAVRHGPNVEYHDDALRTFVKYVPDEGVIYRLPERPEAWAHDPDPFWGLLDAKGPIKLPFPGMEVTAQSRREVVEGGRTWNDIELTLRVVAGDRVQHMRFRIDLRTGLPHSCVFGGIEGAKGMTLYDYPDHGPADIYDLGVPRGAKVVDRMPGDDLSRVLAGLKAGRVRFDDYRGIEDWGTGSIVNRIWRKGRKWRSETLLPKGKAYPWFPRDADAAWWKAHQNDYAFMVRAICDGEKVYYYRAEGNPFAPGAKQPPPVKLSMTQAINPSDDPFMPRPQSFPEHISHPNVDQPSEERDFLVDPKPADGPPGTILLRVRNTRSTEPGQSDFYKLWLDSEKSYVAMRSETSVFDGGKGQKLAFIDTMTIEQLARSPGGVWYPTRVRRKASTPGLGEEVWTFLLDFDVAIPDELFRPLK